MASNLEMEIYAGGVEFIIAWADEEQYQLGKEFLKSWGALFFGPRDSSSEKCEYVYLENKQSFEALLDFRKSLKRA